jgi:hypothetical protein
MSPQWLHEEQAADLASCRTNRRHDRQIGNLNQTLMFVRSYDGISLILVIVKISPPPSLNQMSELLTMLIFPTLLTLQLQPTVGIVWHVDTHNSTAEEIFAMLSHYHQLGPDNLVW